MQECGYCKEREIKMRDYEERIDKEKVVECYKALEREKIAKGMQCTQQDEICLRQMQCMQMIGKKRIEREEEERERMWHQVLLDDVRRKEENEERDRQRRCQEMLARRRVYDEQINSANRKRQEAIQEEREKENRRLEKIKKKMTQDHFEALRRKKEQQLVNKENFIRGHELKMSRLNDQKNEERQIDKNAIRVALDKLQAERRKKIEEMLKLKQQKEIFMKHHDRERKIAQQLEEDIDKFADKWQQETVRKISRKLLNLEADKQSHKKQALEEYRKHTEELNNKLKLERENRCRKMEQVKRTAILELEKQLDNAKEELRRQIEYRNSLNNQIMENKIILESQIVDVENKEKPFTKRADTFKDAMKKYMDEFPAKTSSNPVHPFRRIINRTENCRLQLPSIDC